MKKTDIENSVREWLPEGFFLVEVLIKGGDNVSIYIDSFCGVSISDCQALSRHITGTFDREQEDYTLQVSSAGLDRPFRVEEQYTKNIGRKVQVLSNDNHTTEGNLRGLSEGTISLEKIKNPGKRQNKETEIITIRLENIKSTKLCF
ncbi:MAG: ribosome assembly cofactor RimP [Bacteroidales bacterium]